MRKLAAGLGRTGLAARIVAVAALTAATVGLAATPAGAAPAPVTDYASYPEPLPAGCPDGAAALTGVQFDNGRGDTASDLRNLPVRAGDTVTMSWDGFAANCAAPDGTPAITVGLAVYDTETLHFDHTRDEQLLPGWVICGADAGACPRNGGRYTVSVDVPSAAEPDGSCYVQIDAILGLPLAVVGPNGSYYNNLLRGGYGPNLLVSASNFAIPCQLAQAPTTPSTTPPTTPPTVPTTPSTAPVAAAPPTAAAPVAPAAPAVQVLDEVVTRPRTLPATGSHSGSLVWLALGLTGAGAVLVRTSRRFDTV